MPDDRAEVLQEILARTYSAADHAALTWQAESWRADRPLEGVRVLDATPVFQNTLAKYVPLLAAGADLTVHLSPLLPHDPAIAELLQGVGVRVVDGSTTTAAVDVVLDCAGALCAVASRCGYVELTKSGKRIYATMEEPVLMADDSRIKHIETTLGTGDGFIRGLARFGHSDLSGRSVVVFGSGKVGRGAAWRAMRAGARVTVIDPDPGARSPHGSTLIDVSDPGAVLRALSGAWCVASATGIPGALSPFTDDLVRSGAILANLGAEDESGPDMPADRVLNQKAPVNFALPEPTHLRYLDATFALHNACGLALLTGSSPPGVSPPPRGLEDEILTIVRSRSTIRDELPAIEEELQ